MMRKVVVPEFGGWLGGWLRWSISLETPLALAELLGKAGCALLDSIYPISSEDGEHD